MRQQRTSPAPAAASFLCPACRRARRHSQDTPGLTRGRGPAGHPHPQRAGAFSYGAVPAQLASLRVMAAVPRMMTAGTNLGCAACNPYPAPLCALHRRVPLRRHHPLHAATTLYTPPPPSTRRHRRCLRATPAAPMWHCWSHHWPLPLRAAPCLSVAFVHAPCTAQAPRGAHCRCTCLTRVHTSHMGPRATPLHPLCLGPVPGPIRGCAPRLSPCRVHPRLLGPIRGHAM